jgi:hypothetical protein
MNSVLFGSVPLAMPMVLSSSIGRNTVSAGEIGRAGGGLGGLTGVAACGGGGAVRTTGGTGAGAGFA